MSKIRNKRCLFALQRPPFSAGSNVKTAKMGKIFVFTDNFVRKFFYLTKLSVKAKKIFVLTEIFFVFAS